MKRLTILLFFLLWLTQTVYSQNGKIGYVNVEQVMKSMPEAKEMETRLQHFTDSIQLETNNVMMEVRQRNEEFNTLNSPTDEDREKFEMDLFSLQSELQQLEEASKIGLKSIKERLLAPIMNKIMVAAETVRQEKGLDLILNTHTKDQHIVLAGDKGLDVTKEVINALKKM